jgi:hypothetical protein
MVSSQWSLTLVLRHPTEAPYELLHNASLKRLTFKCAFLLALASRRRSSQLTALSTDGDYLVWIQRGVEMVTKLGFLAKTENINYTPDPISLLEMKYHSDTKEDRIWCPLRALTYYVDRTITLRGMTSYLSS